MKMQREHLSVITPTRPAIETVLRENSDVLAAALARSVADDLRDAIARRGVARLALSGGSTPQRFLQALSREPLAWSRVRVLPVDERWVPPVHRRSNERLLREQLLQNAAAAATLLPLFRPVATPERALQAVMTQIALQALPLDVAVLGMGEDGHVASLFPDLVRRDIGLHPSGRAPLLAVRSSGAPEARMTLTLSAIFTAPALYLHIEGDAKRRVLEAAIDDPRCRLPVRAFLAQAPVTPKVFWCADAARSEDRSETAVANAATPRDPLRSTGVA